MLAGPKFSRNCHSNYIMAPLLTERNLGFIISQYGGLEPDREPGRTRIMLFLFRAGNFNYTRGQQRMKNGLGELCPINNEIN